MARDIPRVYVDANVFLNPVLYDPEEIPEAGQAKEFLKKILANEIKAYTSILTWDEFVWVLRREYDPEFARNKGAEFLTFANLTFESVTFDIVKKAQDLLASYALKPRDAIHLATVLKLNLAEMVTFDSDFSGVSIIHFAPP